MLPGQYRFAHVLVQETLYAALDPARRVRLHRRIVDSLEQLAGADPGFAADLAHHADTRSPTPRAGNGPVASPAGQP